MEPGSRSELPRGDGSSADAAQGGAFRTSDPLGLLVQGMAQLQNAVSESLKSKSKEVEVVKPGIAELPQLADLSNGSGDWWKEVMVSLAAYYEAYTRASRVGKLALRPEDYETSELKDPRWSRVDKRAASMLLASLPAGVRDEILASRLSGSLALLSRVVVLYRPGSVVERQQILTSLESPPSEQCGEGCSEQMGRCNPQGG